ncbi:hypothetical protein DEJ48_36600 [Streptomyces venezuelae]|uniref:Uncharacterized protein n=1 Tax=Streptomyces venezuelae TaxID=54571 RepID=A0A5P2C7I5_STRVZ|nr:hypothetical protein DEJ48_36600 [Streptomyces venezuelae]
MFLVGTRHPLVQGDLECFHSKGFRIVFGRGSVSVAGPKQLVDRGRFGGDPAAFEVVPGAEAADVVLAPEQTDVDSLARRAMCPEV